jgi:hypothetical protein
MHTREYINEYYEYMCSNAVIVICLAGDNVMQRSNEIIHSVIHNYSLNNNDMKETMQVQQMEHFLKNIFNFSETINAQFENPNAGPGKQNCQINHCKNPL